MNIKIIETETESRTISSNAHSRLSAAYKIKSVNAIAETHYEDIINFRVGNKVRHREEGIIGEVKFIGSDKLSVVWEDNTRERMTIAEANDNLDYVDDDQSQVAPLTPQMSDNKEDDEVSNENGSEYKVNEILDDALATLDTDELNSGDVIDMDVDMEKVKMQHKMNKMQNKLNVKQTDDMKDKIAKEVIDLAVAKGIINADDADLEIQAVILLNDEEFAKYKQDVIDYEDDGNEVISLKEDPDDYEGLTEDERQAKIALKSLKGNRKQASVAVPMDDGEIRNVSGMKQAKFSFYNQYTPPKFEDQFTDILTNAVDGIEQTANNQVKVASSKLPQQKNELKGFENLQGLTKPLVPGTGKTAAFQTPTNTSLNDLFSNMDWTTVSKIH